MCFIDDQQQLVSVVTDGIRDGLPECEGPFVATFFGEPLISSKQLSVDEVNGTLTQKFLIKRVAVNQFQVVISRRIASGEQFISALNI